MGFELYLQCFGETESLGLPRDSIRALFPVDEASSEPNFWRLRYDSHNSCDIGVNPLATDATKLAGLYVDGPCRDIRLWDSLFTILNMGSVVLFFPGGRLLIVRETSSAGLPEEMIESMGAPVQVNSGEAIRKIVET
ncbi:MAG TPA: hypothetical protein VGZ91_11770 [Candidatus Sulfotelmatobacter sp.]|jgi:hypothetical protein|nr:hypothetical protein [Candidatus Sulfotelmatobacter sp.]